MAAPPICLKQSSVKLITVYVTDTSTEPDIKTEKTESINVGL